MCLLILEADALILDALVDADQKLMCLLTQRHMLDSEAFFVLVDS